MTYEDLIREAEEYEIEVVEKDFESKAKGLCKGNKIAVRKNLRIAEKTCILAEEIGHYKTTVGDITDQEDILDIKQEAKARAWAYDKLVPMEELKRAFDAGYRDTYEIAEYLDVDEGFLKSSLNHYSAKYGHAFFGQIDEDTKIQAIFGSSPASSENLKWLLDLIKG